MKRVLLGFLACSAFLSAKTQYQTYYGDNAGTLKISAGFTQDFPGLNGYSVLGEYSHSLTERLEGAFAIKRIQLSGYPRTGEVNEYTKATTIDFAVYVLPVKSDKHILRAGIGYTFTFYDIRRSYPVIHTTGTEKNTTWQIQGGKGREKGFNLVSEYEYLFPESTMSVGLRAALYKAYDGVFYLGPFAAVRL